MLGTKILLLQYFYGLSELLVIGRFRNLLGLLLGSDFVKISIITIT